MLSGIIIINHSGLRWCDAPKEYGTAKTLYNRWKRWSDNGVFARIMMDPAAVGTENKTMMIEGAGFRKVVTPAVKREAVAHLRSLLGLSERRACRIAGADRKMIRYLAQRAADSVLRGRLRDLANERRRFGYRRLFVLLRREGGPSGINRIYRLYREEGLTVRKPTRRKAVGTRAPILVEARPNARWSLDFVHHQFAYGQRFRVLNVVDDVTRECLAAVPFAIGLGPVAARWLTLDLGAPCRA